MTKWLFRLLLTLNATSLFIIVFLVQKKYTLSKLILLFDTNVPVFIKMLPDYVSYILYFSIPIILTGISICLSKHLSCDEFKKGESETIEYANNSFLPSYLGYFFVALSINDCHTLLVVYCILLIFTFLSQALYFNPLFLLFGFEFYNVKTKSGYTYFLISRKHFKTATDIIISKAYRINNYTFIDRSKNE